MRARAALNLMEDAVQSRQVAEKLNSALRESERRFREMIDALPAAIYTTDAEGRVTHFNPACVEPLWPYTATRHGPVVRELEASSCGWHANAARRMSDGIALKEGHIVRGAEAILERPDGKRLWFTPYPTPMRDPDGRIAAASTCWWTLLNAKRRKYWASRRGKRCTGWPKAPAR